LASFLDVKWISSVFERSKLIALSSASLYSFSTSLSKILTFRFRLVEEVEREISSI
jgi:hypothetical protein